MKSYPNVTVVDEYDKVVGYMQLPEALEKGLIRRVVLTFQFNDKNEVLIQKRGSHVITPLQYDCSSSGHVDQGETYKEAALRELEEELGVFSDSAEEVCSPFYTPGFYNGVFLVRKSEDVTIKVNQEEVAEIRWISYSDLVKTADLYPEEFTESFMNVWRYVRDKLIIV
jgi:isopentenyldiphosphate isomerase